MAGADGGKYCAPTEYFYFLRGRFSFEHVNVSQKLLKYFVIDLETIVTA